LLGDERSHDDPLGSATEVIAKGSTGDRFFSRRRFRTGRAVMAIACREGGEHRLGRSGGLWRAIAITSLGDRDHPTKRSRSPRGQSQTGEPDDLLWPSRR
jgi:hypothetical protein